MKIKSILNKNSFLVLTLVFSLFLVSSVSAVECGSTPTDGCEITQNTTFNTGTYYLPNGIFTLEHYTSVIVDCNNSVLIGSGSGNGIRIDASQNKEFKNCVIKNYSNGVLFDWDSIPFSCGLSSFNTIKNSVFENNSVGINTNDNCGTGNYHRENKILNNIFIDNGDGVKLIGSEYFNISGNNFEDNINYGVSLTDSAYNNLIYNNTFVSTGIIYSATNNNQYCLDNSNGNFYTLGASGPLCGCLPLVNNLRITSNETVCQGVYNLPAGIIFPETNDLTLNCNYSTLMGSGVNTGIKLDASNRNVIDSCIVKNYTTGIYFTSRVGEFFNCYVSSFNIVKNSFFEDNNVGINTNNGCSNQNVIIKNNQILNNSFLNNRYGVFLNSRLQFHLVSRNRFQNNFGNGLSLTGGNVKYNNISLNNFINNTIQASDLGVNNSWDIFGSGNYWDDYDTSEEGCDNLDGDLFCDIPYNISGSAGSKDYFPFTLESGWDKLTIDEVIPIQVIEGVDLVKDKSTLVRITASLSADSNSSSVSTVKLYWNNTLVESDTQTISPGGSVNFDLWYTPTEAGTNIPIRVELNGTFNELLLPNIIETSSVNVFKTRTLTLSFVSVDNPTNFNEESLDALNFMYKVYPLKTNGISYVLNKTDFKSKEDEYGVYSIYRLLTRIHKSTLIAGQLPERSVGIVPRGWFSDKLGDDEAIGISKPFSSTVIVEEDFADFYDHVVAHEIGHTYGLCDEYDSGAWFKQNLKNLLQCPNGDSDNNEWLDNACNPGGCPAYSLGPLTGKPDTMQFGNFMGGNITDNIWVSKETYEYLLNEFKHESPVFANERAVISGVMNKASDTASFDNFYVIGEGLAINDTEYQSGNYTLNVYDSADNLAYNISFYVSFVDVFFGGNTTENNNSAFAFTIPFEVNYSRFELSEDGVIKANRNISSNMPEITLLNNFSNVVYSNEIITLNWNASDLDGDDLSYAILFSPDNGTTYSTLIFDLNETSYSFNSTDLMDSEYLVKILATDGVNTVETVANESFEIDNDLQVIEFESVFSNDAQRVFKINLNNSFVQTPISNITWQLNTGESIINSTFSLDLQPRENALLFIYYNYTSNGNYTNIFKASSNDYVESSLLEVTI